MRSVVSCFCSLFFLAGVVFATGHGEAATPEKEDTRRVLTRNVNVRAGAGLRFRVTDQLDRNAQVQVLATSRADGEIWHRVRLRSGGIGWVASRLLSAPPQKVAPSQTAQAAPTVQTAQTTPSPSSLPTASTSVTPQPLPGPASSTGSAGSAITNISPTAPVAPQVAVPVVDVAPGTVLRLSGGIGSASDLDFTAFRKRGASEPGPAPGVLIFGGIQGDEPGGFSAASLLVTHYDITRGTIIIAPNLNFSSIVDRSRGSCGDMNRKFAELSAHDPQYTQVQRVQALIQRPEVGLILNLHDGSGFYRTEHQTDLRNPRRWGQSVIIDKATGPNGIDLTAMATTTAAGVNNALLRPDHRIGVRNTRTDEGNLEMAKTLTWFAVRNGKTAFGLEASKELNVAERAYYHLRMVEGFLTQAGVEFSRRFPLTPEGIGAALAANARYTLLEPRTILPLHNIRPRLAGELPLTRPARHESGTPLLAVTNPGGDTGRIQIHHGNNLLTQCTVRWFEADASLDRLPVIVDGTHREVRFGEVLAVRSAFKVERQPGYRVNAIGATAHPTDESGLSLSRNDFQTAYSIDRAGRLYRVETYRNDRLVGMFVVAFGAPSVADAGLPGLASQDEPPVNATDADPAVATRPVVATVKSQAGR